jgi:two-component system, NarL family, response regulator NreC
MEMPVEIITVLMVDDHSAMRDGLAIAFEMANKDLKFLTATGSVQAEKELSEHPECSILLLDWMLVGETGADVLIKLRKIKPDIKTIVYSGFNEPMQIMRALEYSIQGYIMKVGNEINIVDAIRAVYSGKQIFCAEAMNVIQFKLGVKIYGKTTADRKLAQAVELSERYKELTKKEQEVFKLVAEKKDTNEIAALLGITDKTVENHRSHVYQKLNIHDRLEAIEAAELLGLLI